MFAGVILVLYFVNLVQLGTGEFCSAHFNTWKLEGFVRFNSSKDGGCYCCELFLQ
jgi:hypothetical protein